jgi:hypothetical protein
MYFMPQRQFSHMNGRKLDHRQVGKIAAKYRVSLNILLYDNHKGPKHVVK